MIVVECACIQTDFLSQTWKRVEQWFCISKHLLLLMTVMAAPTHTMLPLTRTRALAEADGGMGVSW